MLKRVTMQLYTIVCTMKTKQMVTSRKTNGERHGLQKTHTKRMRMLTSSGTGLRKMEKSTFRTITMSKLLVLNMS